jgi:putative serine/threonine protein kinase
VALEYISEDTALDGEVHFLVPGDFYVKQVLCYPRSDCSEYSERIKPLLDDGFIYFLETGTSVIGIRVLGKGYSAIVVAAKNTKYGLGALKILRIDSRRSSLLWEVEVMKRAQISGLVPRLYTYRDFYIFQELISPRICKPFSVVLEKLVLNGDVRGVKRVLVDALKSLFKLDVSGIDHTELNRPGGHMFYCEGDRVVVIDWESAKISSRPVNLTSFISYIVFRFKYRVELGELLNWSIERILSALRNYKLTYSNIEFENILSALGLN